MPDTMGRSALMEPGAIHQLRCYVRQYFRFAVVGVFVAIAAILLREFVAVVLPPSNFQFSASIAIVWVLGILLSFNLNRMYTFSSSKTKWSGFCIFSVIAVTAGILCIVVSNLALDVLVQVFPAFAYQETIAFVIGNLLASIASFAAYRLFVFR
jgi:putative flippase GtrA